LKTQFNYKTTEINVVVDPSCWHEYYLISGLRLCFINHLLLVKQRLYESMLQFLGNLCFTVVSVTVLLLVIVLLVQAYIRLVDDRQCCMFIAQLHIVACAYLYTSLSLWSFIYFVHESSTMHHKMSNFRELHTHSYLQQLLCISFS
jgi:hypothetical protein